VADIDRPVVRSNVDVRDERGCEPDAPRATRMPIGFGPDLPVALMGALTSRSPSFTTRCERRTGRCVEAEKPANPCGEHESTLTHLCAGSRTASHFVPARQAWRIMPAEA
jgi:hypothetical protein